MNRNKLVAIASASLIVSGLFTAGVSAQAAPSNNHNSSPKKVTICHRTRSTTNPYVRITVSESSIGNAANKHGGSKHDQYPSGSSKPAPNVFDRTKVYTPNQKKWGDIIPNVYTDGTPFTAAGNSTNFTGLGLLIWNNTGAGAGLCKTMSARDLFESEKASGEVTDSQIWEDLSELEADEFASALSSCGGNFATCSNPSLLGAASVTTTTAAPAGGSTTTVAGGTSGGGTSGGGTSGGATTTTVALAGARPSLTAGKGGITALVWVDGDRNGKKASDEPVFPGVTCTATGPGGVSKSAVTFELGTVNFADLDPGEWTVTCEMVDDSLDQVYDSDGTVDWTVKLTVKAGEFAEAQFGAAGTSSLDISGVGTDSVFIKWSGGDGELDTDDDVVFEVKATDGRVSAAGLPAGKYAISATGNFDSEDEVVTLSLAEDQELEAALPTLSKTGLSREPLMSLMAALMLMAGAALLVVRRRPV